jgi:hypothetical protein
MTFLRIALFSAAVAAYAAQAPRTLLPVDEAVSRPDFFTFRARLAAAVAQRDTAAILEVIHPDIKSSFGGDDGIEDFNRIDGRKAYIATRFIRSPIDYRAEFRYTNGRWWLVFFVAGG